MSAGKKIVFVTNNATQSRKSYKKKFDKLGIQAHTDEIFGSAYASAVYVSQILKLPEQKKKVYVIGERGLEDELEGEGIEHLGGTVHVYFSRSSSRHRSEICRIQPIAHQVLFKAHSFQIQRLQLSLSAWIPP
jgi:ribonucleotide monophosphatase NagD (HAD superfamily)